MPSCTSKENSLSAVNLIDDAIEAETDKNNSESWMTRPSRDSDTSPGRMKKKIWMKVLQEPMS